jgi:hypothetical protein
MNHVLCILGWAIAIIIAAFTGNAAARAVTRTKWQRRVLALWVAAGICSLLLWVVLTPGRWRAAVRLATPIPGASVDGPRVTVTGTVDPPDARVGVIVNPETAVDSWWVQDKIKVDVQSGRWSGIARLGNDMAGSEVTFSVMAFASSEPWILQVLGHRSFHAGQILKAPPPAAQSDVVLVYRSGK